MNNGSLIPEFGPLSGVKVLTLGSIVAMPHAGNLMADFGAELIHIERPKYGDTYRVLAPFAECNGSKVSTSWAQDARNRMSLTLETDLSKPEVKEIFMSLIKRADIFMENVVWVEKYGISDEMLMEANPKLVIVHVSGYGRPQFGGDPEVCNRASYDMIGQAQSGWMHLQGEMEPSLPMLAKPWTNDYVSSLHAVFGALAAYTNAQKTGKGQVVDVAQFEAMARIMSDTFVSFTEASVLRTRTGVKSVAFQPYGVFISKDDRYVALGAFGPGVYKRFIKAAGFDAEYYNFKDCASSPAAVGSEKGKELDEKTVAWVKERTADEVVAQMSEFKVGCSIVYTAEDAVKDPHWIDRGNFVEYEDQTLQKNIKAFGIVPKMSDTPGQIWRGAPTVGQDTDIILKKLFGYSEKKIEELRGKGLI
jgi:crotonobetainyl-CoA:carnitine CoA-transferase CaiB-like acyl-CoA transferase